MIPELRIVPLWRVPVEPSSACLLYIDQQKAQACKESGRVLQTLVDSDVEVRTVQGRPLSDVYSSGFNGFRGALHAKTALIRCRAPRADESDRVTLFVGSHNLTRASQANHECVMQLATVPMLQPTVTGLFACGTFQAP